MAHNQGLFHPQTFNHTQQVFAYRGEIVALLGLYAAAMSSLVHRHYPMMLGQQGSHQIPDAAVGSQSVEEYHILTYSAPIPAVKTHSTNV